ncbi:MAG TPA: pyrrolo-quinoline quinone, partial [Anaeromyxobacter sp.]|nr:pyrrolo-quinoline quinone [Anaeromyxobacter sp.]
MRHAVILVALLALSCGSVNDRGACSTSSDCPSGQYCARSADGNVCWADAVAPVVSSVVASCSTTPCQRDGVLRVEAAISDDKELAGVEVALDLDDGTRKVALARAGALWVADLSLRDWPFEAFSRAVVASVVARDGARNETSGAAAAMEMTRLRWVYDAGVPMSAPAVMTDGTVVVGSATTTEQLLAIGATGLKAWSRTVGNAFITATPSVAETAIWAASSDGRLYPATHEGIPVGSGCPTGEALHGGIAQIR